jgi:hypothetical protein
MVEMLPAAAVVPAALAAAIERRLLCSRMLARLTTVVRGLAVADRGRGRVRVWALAAVVVVVVVVVVVAVVVVHPVLNLMMVAEPCPTNAVGGGVGGRRCLVATRGGALPLSPHFLVLVHDPSPSPSPSLSSLLRSGPVPCRRRSRTTTRLKICRVEIFSTVNVHRVT